MRKIIYRGAEQIFRISTSSKTIYVFEQDNGFSATPSTWADYYDIISYDSTHKTLVDAKDPLATTDLRRKSQFEYEVPVEIYEAQVERDIKAKNDKVYQSLIQEYKRGVYDQIASGVIESIPEDIEEMAIAYADKKTAPKEDSVFPKPPEELPPTDEETPADEGETTTLDPKDETTTPEVEPPKEEEKPKASKK